MKVIDIIRKANVDIVAKIIGATVAMNTDKITLEEAMELDYPATLRYLQSDMEIEYKQTNADRIRAMSDAELAKFLSQITYNCGGRRCSVFCDQGCPLGTSEGCNEICLEEWLQKVNQ